MVLSLSLLFFFLLFFVQLDDFYAELKWEFHTWGKSVENLVSKFLANSASV